METETEVIMKYDPHLIEKKWQQFWKQQGTFVAKEEEGLPKYYILDMFPYPSGSGLHVGHLIGYTATDIMARYKWARGFSVLHPMGWDSFGLPAEQYALRTGTHPAITTQINIQNFKVQLESLGYGYDWGREIRTSDPAYYKWTQWIFTKLYEKGLAYQAEMLVNWCPALGTVLANEEIEMGRSKEGGYPIEKRPLSQWVLKITEYADRLLEDLDLVDWPEGLKRLQRNWIGRSHGLLLSFSIVGHVEKLTVFTSCPHTLFGVTYLVLAPEHPLVQKILVSERKQEMAEYQKTVQEKSELERAELNKVKTGLFTGAYAINPVTDQAIAIWVSDYVLMNYGTGAVMGVPAHDERDQEFAEQFSLPSLPVVNEEGKCIQSHSHHLSLDGLTIEEADHQVASWAEARGLGKRQVYYKLRDWLFSRQRYWGEPFPLIYLEGGELRLLDLDELPLEPPQVLEYKPSTTGESPLARMREWVEIKDPKTGKRARRETHTMPQWAGSCWYYLRFCDPHNTAAGWSPEKENYWMPVDLYVGGAEHAVLHLLYARFWHKVLYDCGLVSTREPFQRLVNQGLIVARSYQRAGGSYVEPKEVVEREGRYFHWESGEELRSQVEKMSKSKLNGVSPDEIIEEFGADALRLYSMFMGPIEKEKIWNTEGVTGCRRFLNRFSEMVVSKKVTEENHAADWERGMLLAHRLVFAVTEDIEQLLFNTAIAKLMQFVNEFTPLACYPRPAIKMAVQLLCPFAPHLAEELWQYLGEPASIVHAPWPNYDPAYLFESHVVYVVQINGKVRTRYTLPKETTREQILEKAQQDPALQKYLQCGVKKVVFVPCKLVNFVV